MRDTNMRAEDHIERMLDQALEMTFPASDPFTIYVAELEINTQKAAPERKTVIVVPAHNVT